MATRRNFLAYGGVAAATAVLPWSSAETYPLGLPPGVQLWVVKDELASDFTGTLRALKRIGYSRVEAAGFFGRTAATFRSAIGDAGLECVSCHYSLQELMQDTEAKLAFAKEVGVAYCVASSPAPSRPMPQGRPWATGLAEAMRLADWQSNAEAMNRIGAKAKAMGLRFGYHNHSAEFLLYEGKVAYGELLRITDPELVAMELDIGWVAAAGVDPAEVLRHAGRRIQLLHVKDIATRVRQENRIADDQTTVPIGSGSINWRKVFAAAKQAPIQSWFVEQEAPFAQPPLDGLARSLAYLKSIRA